MPLTLSRILYTLLFYLLLPLILVRLLWRARRQPAYLRHLSERFGYYRQQHPSKPLIWLHAVSVGETRAAAPLIALLQQRYPNHRILLTHTTPTGRDASVQLYGDSVMRCYLPYDLPGAMSRFIDHFQPSIGLLMETELWFNMMASCERENIPLALVNARLSAKSARGYSKIKNLLKPALHSLSVIAAQTDADAARLRLLGAHDVVVVGNLKFDVIPPANVHEAGVELRKLLGDNRPVFLAASTREGEEALVLDAIAQANVANLLTMIVPRHPQRFGKVAKLLKKRGLGFRRRSELTAIEENDSVLLGDSMGEMFAYYGACDAAFIGGSLLPFGGQNLLEACTLGKPVLVGPHTYNFEASAELAVSLGAAVRVANPAELGTKLSQLFGDANLRKKMGKSALAFSADHRGAAEKTLMLIDKLIK